MTPPSDCPATTPPPGRRRWFAISTILAIWLDDGRRPARQRSRCQPGRMPATNWPTSSPGNIAVPTRLVHLHSLSFTNEVGLYAFLGTTSMTPTSEKPS